MYPTVTISFDEMLKNKYIKLSHPLPPLDELKYRAYCNCHNSTSHATNNCDAFCWQCQSTINKNMTESIGNVNRYNAFDEELTSSLPHRSTDRSHRLDLSLGQNRQSPNCRAITVRYFYTDSDRYITIGS